MSHIQKIIEKEKGECIVNRYHHNHMLKDFMFLDFMFILFLYVLAQIVTNPRIDN
jgi:hypothetical protein